MRQGQKVRREEISLPGVPPKSETLSSEKNDIQKSLNWLTSLDCIIISQNIVIVNFLFILVTRDNGFF